MRCETEDGGKRGLVMVRMRVMYESSLATLEARREGNQTQQDPRRLLIHYGPYIHTG